MHNIHSNTYCTVQQDFTSVLLSCSTMYSKLYKLSGYFYIVVLTIQRSKMAFTIDAFCQWLRRFGLDRCRHGQGVADTGRGSIKAEATSHLTALKKTMLHKGHSSALRSTIIQKIMANSLFTLVIESPYHLYVQTRGCRERKCLVVSPKRK